MREILYTIPFDKNVRSIVTNSLFFYKEGHLETKMLIHKLNLKEQQNQGLKMLQQDNLKKVF